MSREFWRRQRMMESEFNGVVAAIALLGNADPAAVRAYVLAAAARSLSPAIIVAKEIYLNLYDGQAIDFTAQPERAPARSAGRMWMQVFIDDFPKGPK